MKRYKYSRTYHLPWSEGISDDDKVLRSFDSFIGKNIVVTEKMDGSNCSLYFDGYIHGRSIDSEKHEHFNWLSNFWNERYYKMLLWNQDYSRFRIIGENLYAKHSIYYNNLGSYFYGFAMYQDQNCFPWEDTLEIFKKLDILPVKEIYKGKFDEKLLISLWDNIKNDNIEGYVIRNVDCFYSHEFKDNVAKFVRKNHVQSSTHWKHQKLIKNDLCINQN